MKVISKARASRSVNRALNSTLNQINRELEATPGVITKLECEISLIPSGAQVSVMTMVEGSSDCRKEVLGVNVRGGTRDHSLRKAASSLNAVLNAKSGSIVDVFSKTVAPLPGRVYTTMITAINEDVVEAPTKDTEARRERIRKTVELLGNAPTALNIARVAEIFGVSRSIIYRDLEALGFDRAGIEEK